MKFGSGVPGVEPPVDGGSGGVALLNQSLDFPLERLLVGEPLFQAGAGQYTELNLGRCSVRTLLGGIGG